MNQIFCLLRRERREREREGRSEKREEKVQSEKKNGKSASDENNTFVYVEISSRYNNNISSVTLPR